MIKQSRSVHDVSKAIHGESIYIIKYLREMGERQI